MGVKTCRAGAGYCLLGNDCTLDEDFLPDDRHGHCDGLRSAFTPSAHFVCCRYSAEANATAVQADPAAAAATTTVTETDTAATTPTQTEPYDDEGSQATDAVQHRATEQTLEETTTQLAGTDWTTIGLDIDESNSEETKPNETKALKRSRIELEDEQRAFTGKSGFTVTEITTNPTTNIAQDTTYPVSSPSKGHTNEHHSKPEDPKSPSSNADENHISLDDSKNNVDSFTHNGVMMDDILKLITEGEWQISLKNNEVTDDDNSESTTDENYTEPLSLSTSYDDQTEATKQTDMQDMDFSKQTESSDQISTTDTEKHAEETTLTPTISTFTTERESSTASLQSDIDIETEIKVHDKSGQESSNTGDSESTTPSDEALSSSTVLIPDLSIKTEIKVKDETEKDNSSEETSEPTTVPNTTPSSTKVPRPATNESWENDGRISVCLGDAIHDDPCWLVRFVDERFDNFLCHGTMISGNLILTSAVCAISLYQAGTKNVKVSGESSTKPPMNVSSIAIHEEYRPRGVESSRYDIGLVSVKASTCMVCMATPNLELRPPNCYTFASSSQGDGDVKRTQCEEVSLQQDDNQSVMCILPKQENLQVHSGAPLVCSGTVAGVASSSGDTPTFTPTARLLPWVQWNVKRLRARPGSTSPVH
ncbi:Uncharacterized protein GBIM_04654 [Gryllus bimaculatus]|nr:Uncharacterized protein GBIM_04654 [Gryllus bimaculatus]